MINPANPTQIFEGSDGGLIRTSGDVRRHLGAMRLAAPQRRRPAADDLGQLRRVQAAAVARADADRAHRQEVLEHAPVHQRRDQPVNAARSWAARRTTARGRTSTAATTRRSPGHLRRRRQRRLRRDEPGLEVQRVHRRFSDSNFRNGDPEKWVITSAPVVNSGEGPAFYWPQIGDPNPAPAAPDLLGGEARLAHLAFGAGTPRAVPQDTAPNIAGYEANCPEFVTSGDQAGCGDYQPLGGPYCDGLASTRRSRRASTAGRPDRHRLRRRSDRRLALVDGAHRGRPRHALGRDVGRGIFVTHNADAADPATVAWHRIDSSTSARHRRASRARSTSTRPTRATRGSPIRATTPSRRRRPATPSASRRTGRRPVRHLHEPERRERHERLPDAVLGRRPAGQRRGPRRCERHAVRRRPTSASFAATTTGPAAGT